MPIWAQDVLATALLIGIPTGYAVLLYSTCLACSVKGCWKMQTIKYVLGLGFVCKTHKDYRPSYRDRAWPR
jgi:hypothetical protein